MKILVTGGRTALGRGIADGLRGDHGVVETDVATGGGTVCGLGDGAETDALVAGVDCIVLVPVLHAGCEGDGEGDVNGRMDGATRRVYNLLLAARNAGVKQVVMVSSLAVFERSRADWMVTERWRPRVSTDAAGGMMTGMDAYLAEFVVREFAREGMATTVLRVGGVEGMDGRGLPETAMEDVVQAVKLAMAKPTAFGIHHVHSVADDRHFPLETERETLGFVPGGTR